MPPPLAHVHKHHPQQHPYNLAKQMIWQIHKLLQSHSLTKDTLLIVEPHVSTMQGRDIISLDASGVAEGRSSF
jgi:hypothetical protein